MASVAALDEASIAVVRRRDTRGPAVAAAAALTLGLVATFGSAYQCGLIVSISLLAIVAAGLNLLVGHAGQISLASGLFIGVGGYTTAVVGADHGAPLPVSVLASFGLAAATGAVLAPIALRVRGAYLALVTLGALVVGEYVFEQWRAVTGGPAGRSVTGAAQLLDRASVDLVVGRQPRFAVWAWLAACAALVVVLACRNIARSAAGRALNAIRDDRRAAALVTIDERRCVIAVFTLSSGLAGIAGALHGAFQGYVTPAEFGLASSVKALTAVVVGGLGSTWGPIWGATAVAGLSAPIDWFSRSVDLPFVAGDRGGPAGHVGIATVNEITIAVLLIVVLVVEPRGVVGLAPRLRRSRSAITSPNPNRQSRERT